MLEKGNAMLRAAMVVSTALLLAGCASSGTGIGQADATPAPTWITYEGEDGLTMGTAVVIKGAGGTGL